MNEWTSLHSQPLEGQPPMAASDLSAHLERIRGWALHDGAIEKICRFGSFHETMVCVNALAWIAHAEDHHPGRALGHDCGTVRFNPHSVGGISINDFIGAARVDALLP